MADTLRDHMPATPPTLEQLKEAIALRIRKVTEVTPDEEITLENTDKFSDSYAACIEAMRDAAVMSFNFIASQLGVTGFQASVAALQAYAFELSIEGPFMIVRLEDALYPQNDIVTRVEEWLSRDDNREWLQARVEEKMAQRAVLGDDSVHPVVLERWKAIQHGHWPKPADA